MKFKKSISFVLTLCMVLSLFATFVIPVAAEEVPFEDGDNVVISYPKDGTAISAEVDYYESKDQYRLAATDLENGAVFTVDITENGTYFICDGKYLTSGATGSNLTLEAEANEYSLWEVEAAENGWYIKNVNAAYYDKPQYIEYYYAFTTYSLNTSKADIYTFQFIVQAKPVTSQVVTNWNTSEWGSADEAHIFTDAEAYAAATHAWWFHAAFAPTETDGVYEVTAVRAPNTVEAAPYLAIPENGFVWVAHDTAAAGTAGAYAVAVLSNVAVGDKVTFTGLDIANCTTTEDATAEKVVEEPVVDPDAPVSIALGKTYTYPTDGLYFHWSDEWPCTDNVATALTDGEKVAGYYGVGTTSGWGGASPNPLEVVIDLEAVYSIDSFAYTVCGGVDGISMPASVAIYVSEDGENFTAVDVTIVDGELVCPIGWTTCADRTSVATAAAAVEGRYVKFSFTKEGNFVFINELEVFGEAVTSEEPEAGLAGETVSQWGAGAGFDVLTDGYNGVGEVNHYDPYQSKLFGVASGVMEATDYTLTFVVEEQDINTITLYALDFANGGVMLPDAVTFVVNGVEYEAVINANENGIATIVAELGETVTADTIVANVAMGASPYTFTIFNMFTEFETSLVEAPALNEVDGGELPAHNPRAGSLSIAANTAITYTVAFEHGANFNLWSEDVTVLVNGEALEMGMLGYVAVLAKGDTVTIVNAGAEAVEIYPSIAPVIPGTMSSPIVLDELGDITTNVTEDIVMDNGAVFYTYTAPENGTLTITMPEGNWTYTVNNLTAGLYGDTQWSDSDPVLSTYSIEVSAGDEIQIIVGTYNPDEPYTAPVGELTFNAAFEAVKVTSNVVTDWNTSKWGGADEAHIFTNQEAYLACTHTWWSHVSFKPTNYEGVYEVVAIRGATGEAAAYEIAEGGFIWLAHDTAAEGTAGAYAHALIKTLAVGDLVKFTGIDVANCTTTEDATAEKWEALKAGDVNKNGEIDATDYTIIRKLVLGTLTAEDIGDLAYSLADVNGDGKVNARDYYLVKRAFLGTYVIPGWEVEEDEAE